jgi:hypothetical protein
VWQRGRKRGRRVGRSLFLLFRFIGQMVLVVEEKEEAIG